MNTPHPDPASLREELREKIARCIEPEYFSLYEAGGPNKERDGQTCDSARKRADTIIDTISSHLASAGWRVVPVEPTRAMRTACTFEAAEVDWPAMLRACPNPLAPPDRSMGETDG